MMWASQWKDYMQEMELTVMTAIQEKRRRRLRAARRLRLGLLALGLVLAGVGLRLLSPGDRASGGNGTPADPQITSDSADRRVDSGRQEADSGWREADPGEVGLTEGTLVLVNGEYSFDPGLPDLVSVYEIKDSSYQVKNVTLSVTPETGAALNRWLGAFAAQTGIRDVNIVAGYRSYEDQAALYQNALDTKGLAHAQAYLALPGHSEHHTGLAVDLDTYDPEAGTSGGFHGEGVYRWAVDHAWEYGFVLRYPPEKQDVTGISYESWHFRYVGLPHARIMASEELCLEEYLQLLRAHPFAEEHLWISCLGQRYELYFCPGDRLTVPTDAPYTVSGNNVDGYVVTVERDS